jgi:hypothetical protein
VQKTTFNSPISSALYVPLLSKCTCFLSIGVLLEGPTSKTQEFAEGSVQFTNFFHAGSTTTQQMDRFISIGVFMDGPPSKTQECAEHTLRFTNFFCAISTTAQQKGHHYFSEAPGPSLLLRYIYHCSAKGPSLLL